MLLTIAAGRCDPVSRHTDNFAFVSRIGNLCHDNLSFEENVVNFASK